MNEHRDIPTWPEEAPPQWEVHLNRVLWLEPQQPRRGSVSSGRKGLAELLERNREWAEATVKESPYFFSKLSAQQNPEILWIGMTQSTHAIDNGIGCSDARVPPNQILNLKPGEVFVHCNIANQVGTYEQDEQKNNLYEIVHSDLNCLSVIEYAVVHLKVKHIIVCGHYGCTGIKAALSQQEFGIVDNWLRNIKDLYIDQQQKLHGKPPFPLILVNFCISH